MRTVALIVVLALVASSQAAHATFKKPKAFKIDAASIENQQRKQTVTFTDLVNFFQTHDFQVNDQLNEFLDNLVAQIQDEHNQHLALYTQQREELAEEYEFRQSEIEDGQASYDASQTQLNLAENEQTRASNLGDLAAQALTIYNQQLDDLRTNRAVQIAEYQTRRAWVDQAIVAINEAENILDEFEMAAMGIVPASFIQVVNNLLAVGVKTGHSNHVLPIYNKLLQAQSKQSFDVNDIREIRDFLDTMIANLQAGGNTLDDAEATNSDNFNAAQDNLVDVIARLTDQYNQSVAYVARLQNSIDQETSISLQAAGKIQRNSDLLDQAHQLGDDCDAEFQQGESTRKSQLELLFQLKSAVQALEVQYGESLLPNIGDLVNIGA
jgi:hypothetical protein